MDKMQIRYCELEVYSQRLIKNLLSQERMIKSTLNPYRQIHGNLPIRVKIKFPVDAFLNPRQDFVKIKDIVNEKLKSNDTGLAEYSKTYGRAGYDIIQKMCQIRLCYSNDRK